MTPTTVLGLLLPFMLVVGFVSGWCRGWLRGNLGFPLGRGIKPPKKVAEISPEEMETLAQQRQERSIEDQREKVEAQVAERYSDLPKPLQDATVHEIMAKGKELFPHKA